jgi:uncharacterized membrane protein (DUF485 family)
MTNDRRLQSLLRQQQVLAWGLSALTLSATVSFFVALSVNAPFLSRKVGTHTSAATIVAVAILAFFVVSILLFARLASRVDDARGDA